MFWASGGRFSKMLSGIIGPSAGPGLGDPGVWFGVTGSDP